MDTATHDAIAKLTAKVEQLEREVCDLKRRLPDEPITAPITEGELAESDDGGDCLPDEEDE